MSHRSGLEPRWLLPLAVAGCVAGCTSNDEELGLLELGLKFDGPAVATKVEFVLRPVKCSSGHHRKSSKKKKIRTTAKLEDQRGDIHPDLPFGIETLHAIASSFIMVKPGCYAVTAVALQKDDEPVCKPVSKPFIEVQEGQTAEVVLLSQCPAPGKAAFAPALGVNHAPVISHAGFEDTFVHACGQVAACVAAWDKDRDRIEFQWSVSAGGMILSTMPRKKGNGFLAECVLVAADGTPLHVKVTAFDLLPGAGQRVETLLQQHDPDLTSRARLRLLWKGQPGACIHGGCPPGGAGMGGMAGMGGKPGDIDYPNDEIDEIDEIDETDETDEWWDDFMDDPFDT